MAIFSPYEQWLFSSDCIAVCDHLRVSSWAGLPEEMRIRQAVLKRKLGVVAISSLHATEHGKGCWTLERGDHPGWDDLVSVHSILNVIFKKLTLNPAATRIYLLGVSSGGAFAMILPQLMQVDGLIIQIMGLPSSILAATLAEASASQSTSYPPTVFMHMPKDGHVGSLVESNINDLKLSGFKATQIRRNSVSVTSDYLRSRAPSVFSDELANDIVDKLDKDGFLDVNGLLKADPRLTYKSWTKSVGPLLNESISLVSDSSPLTELLNLAWAGHEIMSDGVVEALKWLQAPDDIDELKVLEDGILNNTTSTP